MPRKIGYHRPARRPDAARLYEHQRPRQADKNFYSSARWIRLRDAFLAEHPVCGKCGRALATHVHHVRPRKADPDLAFEWDNLASRCQPCHNAEEQR